MHDLIQSTLPGTTARGVLDVPLMPETRIPYSVVRGIKDGPILLVTAGVHGAEYASIDAAYEIANTDPGTLCGTLVILPIVNPSAFWQRSIYVNPIDGRNLNRMFPGRAGGIYFTLTALVMGCLRTHFTKRMTPSCSLNASSEL